MKVLMAFALLASLILLAQTYHKANRTQGNDLTCYLLAAEALAGGENPYQTESPFPYYYPLLLPLLLVPLTVLPSWLAVLVWFLLNLYALGRVVGLCLEWAWASVPEGVRERTIWILLVVALLQLPVIANNFLNGQINYPLLLLLLLGLKMLLQRRRRLASVLLSAAMAVKVLPAFLLLFLLLRREWRAGLLSIFFALIFCALPVVVTGAAILEYYHDYAREILLAGMADPGIGLEGRVYFSFSGISAHLLGPTALSQVIAVLAGAALVAVLIGRGLAPREMDRNAALRLFSAHLLAMLILSPMSETHHIAYALPAICLLGIEQGSSGRNVRLRSALFWISLVLIAVAKAWSGGPLCFLGVLGLLVCVLLGAGPGAAERDRRWTLAVPSASP